jgi:hypothetical protein
VVELGALRATSVRSDKDVVGLGLEGVGMGVEVLAAGRMKRSES